MAYVVAGLIWIVGMAVTAITWTSGFYGKVPLKIAIITTACAVLIALTHDHIPSW